MMNISIIQLFLFIIQLIFYRNSSLYIRQRDWFSTLFCLSTLGQFMINQFPDSSQKSATDSLWFINLSWDMAIKSICFFGSAE